MKQFESDTLAYLLWMTRAEWQLVHGLSFAWEVHGLMPEFRTLGASYRWVIAKLQREHGYEFSGLRVDQDGDLWSTVEEPVCRENVATIQLMRSGLAPDLEVHLAAAIAFAEQRVPGLDAEPLRQVLDDLRRKIEQIRLLKPEIPAETREAIRDGVRARAAYFRQTKEFVN